MLIRDVMNAKVQVIRPDANVIEAARQMRDGDFGAMPVCDEGNVVGMITDRDLAVRVLAEGKSPQDTTIQEVMTAEILPCYEDDPVEQVVELMANRQVRRLPVLDRSGKLVGMVSVGDLALVDQDEATEAISGISEQRHDEPGQTLNH